MGNCESGTNARTYIIENNTTSAEDITATALYGHCGRCYDQESSVRNGHVEC